MGWSLPSSVQTGSRRTTTLVGFPIQMEQGRSGLLILPDHAIPHPLLREPDPGDWLRAFWQRRRTAGAETGRPGCPKIRLPGVRVSPRRPLLSPLQNLSARRAPQSTLGPPPALPGQPLAQMKVIPAYSPLDLEIETLLGRSPSRFVVLRFDGIELDFFGTPYDSPSSRERYQNLAKHLNDPSDDLVWKEMLNNWSPQIQRQFGPIQPNFRPFVDAVISEVVPGHSQFLHCAIRLIEDRSVVSRWKLLQANVASAMLTDQKSKTFTSSDALMPVAICKAFSALLKAKQ